MAELSVYSVFTQFVGELAPCVSFEALLNSNLMKILIAQINPIIGDLSGNREKIIDAIHKGRQQQAEIVLFPELSLTGYPPEDLLLLPHFLDEVDKELLEVAKATTGIIAIVGTPRKNLDQKEKFLYNSAAVLKNGAVLGYYDKMLLPTYDVFDEHRYFEPGVGAKVWNLNGLRVAITICEDIWQHSDLVNWTIYRSDPIADLETLRVDLVLNLSASPYSLDKADLRAEVASKAAETLMTPLILCNQVGGNDSLIFDGYSCYCDANGNLIASAKGFQEDFLLIDTENTSHPLQTTRSQIEDLYRALVLGTRDYFHKQGFKKACLGLSGGIDSAVVACLAVEALGKENVLGVLMPSRYSSEGSVMDARELANNIGIQTEEINIEKPFQSYLDTLAPQFEGFKPDHTEENLQARVRGMLLMALSNKKGYIVLTTSNKSEFGMGYATLYGDMCGGLAVISDVTKAWVYALAAYINRDKSIIPHASVQKPPSAELRPNQKDSDSLPVYAIIDNVIKGYVEEHLTPREICAKNGYSEDLVEDIIRRIHASEYKRRQAAPALRVTEKAFTVGRRFPIVQKFS